VIIISRGDDEVFNITIKDKNGNPFDLTNYTIKCEIKSKPGGAEAATGTVQVINATQGQIQVTFPASQTSQLTPGIYYMDIMLQAPGGSVMNYPKPPWQVQVLERITD